MEAEKPKHAGGRPPHFDSTDEMNLEVEKYFILIDGEYHEEEQEVYDKNRRDFTKQRVIVWDRKPEPPTITGLSLFLGFASRQSMYDYEKKNEEFSYAIKRARSRIECAYEKALWGDNPTGPIFALKQFGWSDKLDAEGKDNELVIRIARG